MTTETATPKSISSLIKDPKKLANFAETLILLDWDDTLFPSSCLASLGYHLDTPLTNQRLISMLNEISVLVEILINHMKKIGQVCIITNAEKGWVEHSARKYMPRLNQVLSTISIISARTQYEKAFPDNPYKWKFYAFELRIKQVFQNRLSLESKTVQVISFGDSNYEREALRNTLGSKYLVGKSIKFRERPTIEHVLRQIELVLGTFDFIFTTNSPLDLELSSIN